MSRDQQAMGVNISDDEWIEFRTLAMPKRQGIADSLGELVRPELHGSRMMSAGGSLAAKPERTSRRRATSVPVADQKLLTGLPGRPVEPPPGESGVPDPHNGGHPCSRGLRCGARPGRAISADV